MHFSAEKKMAEAGEASSKWVSFFQANRCRDWAVSWDAQDAISPAERRRIASSIAEFQRGESSEGRVYLRKSERFARRAADLNFHAASVLFVREENQHAILLLRFMQLVGIPRRHRAWSDCVFRWLRAGGDLGWTSRVLLVAELVAQEYYPCLREATRHPILRRICDKIIFDEHEHITFQIQRILRVEAALGDVRVALRNAAQTAVLVGAAAAVWINHRRVLSVKMGAAEFFRRTLERNRCALEQVRSGYEIF